MASQLVRLTTRLPRTAGFGFHHTLDECKSAASLWASAHYATAEYPNDSSHFEIAGFDPDAYGLGSCRPIEGEECPNGEESCEDGVSVTNYWEERFSHKYGAPKWGADPSDDTPPDSETRPNPVKWARAPMKAMAWATIRRQAKQHRPRRDHRR